MPSLADSAVIILIGLLLFGPKGLAQIARQLGKLMAEFRRASNEFKMQMEEELRLSEQEDRQKKIAEIEAAAPTPPVVASSTDEDAADHAHLRAAPADAQAEPVAEVSAIPEAEEVAPIPIATSGDLSMMPPSTGLPMARGTSSAHSTADVSTSENPESADTIAPLLEAVPHVDAPSGHVDGLDPSDQKPMRYTNHHEDDAVPPVEADAAARESVHG